jgi:ACS family hexuronate transporter-like MFS transporter
MGGMAGSIGGMLIATATGWVLQRTGSYVVMFLVAGGVYLLALATIQALVPRLEPAEVGEAGGAR